ncbi:MAG: ATP-binding protein [Candidatus Heimdallarchaeaceae archaeon]
MSKKNNLHYEKKYNYQSKKHSNRVLKSLLSIISVVSVGIISLFFLFPEITVLIPSTFVQSFSIFCESVGTAIVIFFTSVLTNKYFLISLFCLLICLTIIFFLPYRPIKSEKQYTLKKLGLPLYRAVSMVVVYSSSCDNPKNFRFNAYANKTHSAFLSSLLMKFKLLSLVFYKNNENLNMLLPIVSKGFNLKNIQNKIRRQIDFVANSLDTHYGSKIKELSAEQVNNLLISLEKMESRTKVDLTSDLINNFNLTDQLHNTLLRKDAGCTCLLIKAEKKSNDKSHLASDMIIFSENRKIESHVLNSCGLKKKKTLDLLNKRLKFTDLLFSSLRKKNLSEIDELSTLFHIPLNYKGGPISLRSSSTSTNLSSALKDQNLMIVGQTVEGDEMGKDVTINVRDLLLNIEIFGMIGRGKTKLVSSLLKQVLDYNISALVFDIKGEYSRFFIDDPRVEIFTIGEPRPLCLNLFETIDSEDVHNTLLIIEEMMMSSNLELTPSMKNLFETALFQTHASSKRNLQTFVENVYKTAENIRSTTNNSYIQQTIDAVLNRLNFIFNPINYEILGAIRTTLDLSLLDDKKSIILDLSQFQKRAARPSDIFLICNLILKKLYRHASAKEITDKLRYVVVLEEAINIIPNFYRPESSASLITSENNFLLGRSLGIGHITISQLWSSVSNIVHGNSATKIIFRSSEKADVISKSINLSEDEINKIQTLPTQHCFIFFEGSEKPLKIRTFDLLSNPLNFAEYRSKIIKRYGRSVFPLLYNNFIEMRTSLYQKYNLNTKKKFSQSNQGLSSSSAQSRLKNFPLQVKTEDAERKAIDDSITEKETMDFVNSAEFLPENLLCEQLCPEKNHGRDCIKYNIGSKIIKTIITKNSSSKELAFLLDNPAQLLSIVKDYAEKRNLEYDSFLAFCTVKSLTLDLVSGGILTFQEAFEFLKKFSPQTQTTMT